jgi:type VI protein secretion system component Hcp
MRCGEPDLEKIQQLAHEQAEMLKQDKKEIVSGAIVKMPQTFLKPVDYSVTLLLKPEQHPTLKSYVA